MRTLKIAEECRADSELEAKEIMELFRAEAKEKGYHINKSGYTYKAKKSKGDIIDEAWVVSITKEYGSVWEEI